MKRPVYIFRGSPASGKGTLVPLFCKMLPQPVALIEHDTLRWGFHKVGRVYAEVGEEEHLFAFNNLLTLVEQYLKSDRYNIVIEGLFTWSDYAAGQGNMKRLIELVESYEREGVAVLLKADKKELKRRNSLRSYAVPHDEFEMLYANVYKEIGASEIVIDTTGKTPAESAELLRERLA